MYVKIGLGFSLAKNWFCCWGKFLVKIFFHSAVIGSNGQLKYSCTLWDTTRPNQKWNFFGYVFRFLYKLFMSFNVGTFFTVVLYSNVLIWLDRNISCLFLSDLVYSCMISFTSFLIINFCYTFFVLLFILGRKYIIMHIYSSFSTHIHCTMWYKSKTWSKVGLKG